MHFPLSRDHVVSHFFPTSLPSAGPQTEPGQLQFLCQDLLSLCQKSAGTDSCLAAVSFLSFKSWILSVSTCVKHTVLQTPSQCVSLNSSNALSLLLLAGGVVWCPPWLQAGLWCPVQSCCETVPRHCSSLLCPLISLALLGSLRAAHTRSFNCFAAPLQPEHLLWDSFVLVHPFPQVPAKLKSEY